MKNIHLILTVLLATLSSCTYEDFSPKDWAIQPELTVSTASIVLNSLARTDTVMVETNYNEFYATCDASWCHIKVESDSKRVIIATEPNTTAEVRNTQVVVNIKRGNKSMHRDISVVQFGGTWAMIGQFPVFMPYELHATQMEVLEEIFNKLVFVKGSTFDMGYQSEDPTKTNYVAMGLYNGFPSHPVTLTDYYIGSTEITQREWNAVMGENNSVFVGANRPIDNISWEEAMAFVSKLSELTRLNISLPTEAQWEYAARGGIYSRGYLFPGSDDYTMVAHNIKEDEIDESDPRYTTKEVGTLLPNELGLYDMAGNVAEICADYYADNNTYQSGLTNPTGPSTGKYHVCRGGDFTVWFDNCLTSYSRKYVTKSTTETGKHSLTSKYYGLRIVLNP